MVVHDAVQFAGPGAEVAATLQHELFDALAAPIERVGARFVPNPAPAVLESQVYPSAERIVAAAQRTLASRPDARGTPWLTSPSTSLASRSRSPRPR